MDSFRSQSQFQSQSDHSQPLFYSPALPSELLWYIIHHCSYPTTLIICSSRLEFLRDLARDVQRGQQGDEESKGQQHDEEQGERDDSPQTDQAISGETQEEHQLEARGSSPHHISEPSQQKQAAAIAQPTSNKPIISPKAQPVPGPGPGPSTSQFLASPLYQIAISRHIRTVFIPTVSHLRAFLSVFDPSTAATTTSTNTKAPVPPPPSTYQSPSNQQSPRKQQLVVYGFLALHRDSSEWSVQGLNNTLSVLLEAGRRSELQVVVVEPVGDGEGVTRDMDGLLGEKMPVVSGSVLKKAVAGEHLERNSGGLMGRMVDVRKVLGRWFRFGVGEWERGKNS